MLCANNHASIDAILAFLKSGTKLTLDNLGLVFIQIKNDPRYTHIPKPDLFKSMDPYDLGVLNKADAAVPIIRIIFALAAKTPSLHVTRHDPSSAYGAVVYDIWVSGLSSNFLEPIGLQTDIWRGLLRASYSWNDIYKAPTNRKKQLRRSMNPGTAFDDRHWSCWA